MFIKYEELIDLPMSSQPKEKVKTYMDKDLKKLKKLNVNHSSSFYDIEGLSITGGRVKQVLSSSVNSL